MTVSSLQNAQDIDDLRDEESLSRYALSVKQLDSVLTTDSFDFKNRFVVRKSEKKVFLVDSTGWSLLMSLVVLANAVEIGIRTDNPSMSSAPFEWFENGVLIIYLLELGIRLMVHGWIFFKSGFNVFDSIICVSAILDTWVLGSTKSLQSLTVLRILRLFRLARLIRLVRFLPGLAAVVNVTAHGLRSLGWLSLLIVVFLWSLGILVNLVLGTAENWLFVNRRYSKKFEFIDIPQYFGKVWLSSFSLFQVATLDKWSNSIARPICEIYPILWLFFISFIFLISLGLLNVMIALISSDAIVSARTAQKIKDERNKFLRRSHVLILRRTLRRLAQRNPTDLVSPDQWNTWLFDPDVSECLKRLHVSKSEALSLYSLLVRQDPPLVEINELVTVIAKARRETSGQDIAALLMSARNLGIKIDGYLERLDKVLKEVAGLVRIRSEIEKLLVNRAGGRTGLRGAHELAGQRSPVASVVVVNKDPVTDPGPLPNQAQPPSSPPRKSYRL